MPDTRTPAQRARYRARRRRQVLDRWLPLWLVVPVMLVLLLATLPLTLPVVAVLHWRDGRRLRAAVLLADCAVCGARLGQAALDRAEAVRAERMAAFRQAHPNVIPRIPPSADAVCAACGAEYRFPCRAPDVQPARVKAASPTSQRPGCGAAGFTRR